MNLQSYASSVQNGLWTEAFSKAFEALRDVGGGELTVPEGTYLTGAVRMYANTILRLLPGAVIRFARGEEHYPLIESSFEGEIQTMHAPCLYAKDAENVTVCGDGTLDGDGEPWWQLKRNNALAHPRPYLVMFENCRHVRMEGVTLRNSPCWTVHPLLCEDVTLKDLKIHNPYDAPNTDGIDPDQCRDVRIQDCLIDVGDDCIAVKSGMEFTRGLVPCERIIISGCQFLHGHGGVVLGSEMSGSIRDVTVTGCVFSGTDRGIRLKTRRGRGGVVEDLQVTGCVMRRVMCPFVFNMYYFCGHDGKMKKVWDKSAYPVDSGTPVLRNVILSNITAGDCGAAAGYFYGLTEQPVQNVILQNIIIDMDPEAQPDTPAMMTDAPLMKNGPLYLRNVRGIRLRDVVIGGCKEGPVDADESVVFA